MKQLLQLGASRTMKNHKDQTPFELLNILKPRIRPLTSESTNASVITNQFQKFEFYLGLYEAESICCPQHAPLEKVPKSSKIMKSMIFINAFIFGVSIAGFIYATEEFDTPDHPLEDKKLGWYMLCGLTTLLFIISMTLFGIVTSKDPGYTVGIPYKSFYEILDKALKEDRNLEYFCFFCRGLWSNRGVHCQICGKCVEGFDHHCNFVNNCIGYRNHCIFLVFLIIFMVYSFLIFVFII